MMSGMNERSTRSCAMTLAAEESSSAVRTATRRMRIMRLAYSTSEPGEPSRQCDEEVSADRYRKIVGPRQAQQLQRRLVLKAEDSKYRGKEMSGIEHPK